MSDDNMGFYEYENGGKIKVGLYFNGKYQHLEISEFKYEMEKIVKTIQESVKLMQLWWLR